MHHQRSGGCICCAHPPLHNNACMGLDSQGQAENAGQHTLICWAALQLPGAAQPWGLPNNTAAQGYKTGRACACTSSASGAAAPPARSAIGSGTPQYSVPCSSARNSATGSAMLLKCSAHIVLQDACAAWLNLTDAHCGAARNTSWRLLGNAHAGIHEGACQTRGTLSERFILLLEGTAKGRLPLQDSGMGATRGRSGGLHART